MLVASVLILWRAFCTPNLAMAEFEGASPAIPRTITNARFTRELDEFAPLLERPLGAPLYDPTPVVQRPPKKITEPKVVKKDPKPSKNRRRRRAESGLKVIGTALEPGKSVAIIIDSEGSIQLRGEGDSIETPAGVGHVESIGPDEVVVVIDDDTLTLKMP